MSRAPRIKSEASDLSFRDDEAVARDPEFEASVSRLRELLEEASPGIKVSQRGADEFPETGQFKPIKLPLVKEAAPHPGNSQSKTSVQEAAADHTEPMAEPTAAITSTPEKQSRPQPTPRPARQAAVKPKRSEDLIRQPTAKDRSHSPVRPESTANNSPAEPAGSSPRVQLNHAPQPAAPGTDFRLKRDGELWQALLASRQAFTATAVFSFTINLLMLTGPLFMLQVYDRVMTSGSIPTLVALSVLTASLYAVIGLLELVRSRVVVRIGMDFDRRVTDRVFNASLRRSVTGSSSSTTILRELDSIRQFIAGPGPITLFDAPWTPIYLLVIFLMHWSLGIAATLGAAVLVTLAIISERMSRSAITEAGKGVASSLEIAETGQRNAEALTAMGMQSAYRRRWQSTNSEALSWQLLAADRLGTFQSITKSLRLGLQSFMLAIGAALALNNEISAGTIVAATIIFGRALAPVEQAVGHWRNLLRAVEGYFKLDDLLRSTPEPSQRTVLSRPEGHLSVNSLSVTAPNNRQPILNNLNCEIAPGQMCAVIGPSASGKSTLARALVGLWPPAKGSVRIDGARLDQWDQEALGQHIGYLPQSVELFAGSVRENIARFRTDVTDDDVIAAAKEAHAHDLILNLPQGYETQLGSFATHLSAGQRQRLALARALFGSPRLVVLDEPNANLDRIGDDALDAAIDDMRADGKAIVLVSHRVQAIGKADLLLFIDRGVQRAFGPRQEVMKMFQNGQTSAGGQNPGRRKTDETDA
ncbi:MAG: type I secretion system permease/ATPase [Pseudomonadota bacterium]